MVDVPAVVSISYGSMEKDIDPAVLNSFSTEAQKLGLRGVTLIAASGDDGVAGFTATNNRNLCSYSPFFPASCPYVTAVGGTMVSF
jgi:tripeptidyl-peptidase I